MLSFTWWVYFGYAKYVLVTSNLLLFTYHFLCFDHAIDKYVIIYIIITATYGNQSILAKSITLQVQYIRSIFLKLPIVSLIWCQISKINETNDILTRIQSKKTFKLKINVFLLVNIILFTFI